MKHELRFPKRAYGGAWNGKLVWGRLTHGRVLGMLKNPSYAGMYVFGRYQYRQEISLTGEVRKRMQAVAMPAWRVRLQQHHEGYIPWEEFLENAERLQKNRTNGEETVLSGPAREGLALLQGLLLCGHCGRALTVRYTGNGGIHPTLEHRWNDALLHLEDLKKQAADFRRLEARVSTPEQRAKVLALARDFPRLWHAPTTQAKDRKRMLRLLIKDVTVEKSSQLKQLLVHT